MAVYTSAICTRAWKPEPLSNMTILSTFPNLEKICWRATMVTYVRIEPKSKGTGEKKNYTQDSGKRKKKRDERKTKNEKTKKVKKSTQLVVCCVPF